MILLLLCQNICLKSIDSKTTGTGKRHTHRQMCKLTFLPWWTLLQSLFGWCVQGMSHAAQRDSTHCDEGPGLCEAERTFTSLALRRASFVVWMLHECFAVHPEAHTVTNGLRQQSQRLFHPNVPLFIGLFSRKYGSVRHSYFPSVDWNRWTIPTSVWIKDKCCHLFSVVPERMAFQYAMFCLREILNLPKNSALDRVALDETGDKSRQK